MLRSFTSSGRGQLPTVSSLGGRASQDSGNHGFRLISIDESVQSSEKKIRVSETGNVRDDASSTSGDETDSQDSHDPVLDVVDPEVATKRTLTNVQNDIFFPPMLRLPRDVYDAAMDIASVIGRRMSVSTNAANGGGGVPASSSSGTAGLAGAATTTDLTAQTARAEAQLEEAAEKKAEQAAEQASTAATTAFASGKQTNTKTDVEQSAWPSPTTGSATKDKKQPKIVNEDDAAAGAGDPEADDDDEDFDVLDKLSPDEEDNERLEEHIRILLTRKEKNKRMLKGFLKFAKTPVGFIMVIYLLAVIVVGTLLFVTIVKWWQPVGVDHDYWVEVWNQAITALFTVTGIGFFPSRLIDTWHMSFIWGLRRRAMLKRDALGLPPLEDPNDLPRSAAFRAYEASLDETRRKRAQEEKEEDEADLAAGRKPRKHPHGGHHLLHRTQNRDEDCSDTKSIEWQEEGHHGPPVTEGTTSSDGEVEAQASKSTGSGSGDGQLQPNEFPNDSIPLQRTPTTATTTPASRQMCPDDVSLLTLAEEKRLAHHQRVFLKLHDWYHYHESVTHRAFSHKLMVWIVLLLNLNSMLQCALSGVTWSISKSLFLYLAGCVQRLLTAHRFHFADYHNRNGAMVAVLMIAGFVTSGVSGYLISRGGNKTKKTEVVERMLREELEIEARKRIRKEELRQNRIEMDQQGLLPPKSHNHH